MTKDKLLENVRKGDDIIKGIQEDQLIIIKNFVQINFNIIEGDIFLLNDKKIKLHHLSFTEGGKKINLHYQLVKANGKAESTIFTARLHENLKIEKINENLS